MSRFEDHELIILETGRMGEPINGLRKMSIGRHRYVEIKDGDLVYIVTTPSIAKEAVMARVENMVYRYGVSRQTDYPKACVYQDMEMRVICS